MVLESVPYEDDDQTQITPVLNWPSPYSSAWWVETTITDIPLPSVGYLLAQGWEHVSVRLDETAKPPTPYYTMKRKTLQTQAILEALLISYKDAKDEATYYNSTRYNDVVQDWGEMIFSSQTQFDRQVTEQNAHLEIYLGDLVLYMDAVKKLIEDNETKLIANTAVATIALTALDGKLLDLEDNYGTTFDIIDTLLSDQETYLSDFLTPFATKLAELNTNYTAHLAKIETLLGSADTDIGTFVSAHGAQVAALGTAYTDHVSELDVLLTAAGGYLTTVETDIGDVLTAIGTDYTDMDTDVGALLTEGSNALNDHATDFNAVLSMLESDYDLHAGLARGFLVDLGSTELARINEQFNASLAAQVQQLVDQGLYSSAVAADITARNTRDRSEEIGILNDRLNREKLANQHTLYGQQAAMRTGAMAGQDRLHTVRQEVWRYQASQITGLYGLLQAVRERTLTGKQAIYAIKDANNRLNIEVRAKLHAAGQEMRRVLLEEAARRQQLSQAVTQWQAGQRDRLLEQIQNIVAQRAAGLDRQHAAQQAVSGAAVSVRNTLLGQLQDAVKGFLAGKERYAALTMQNASTLAEQRHRMIVERMNEIAFREQGGQKKHDEAMRLMAYQLDERNKLLIGLYGFVERRSDIGPSMENLTQLITSLGDSGGGWVTP